MSTDLTSSGYETCRDSGGTVTNINLVYEKIYILYVTLISSVYTIVVTTRSSWLNCALRDDEALYWVSIGHYKAVAVDN